MWWIKKKPFLPRLGSSREAVVPGIEVGLGYCTQKLSKDSSQEALRPECPGLQALTREPTEQ